MTKADLHRHQMILACLRKRPRQRARDIAERLGWGTPQVSTLLGTLHRWGQVRAESERLGCRWSVLDGPETAIDRPRREAPKQPGIDADHLEWMAYWKLPRAERRRRVAENRHAV